METCGTEIRLFLFILVSILRFDKGMGGGKTTGIDGLYIFSAFFFEIFYNHFAFYKYILLHELFTTGHRWCDSCFTPARSLLSSSDTRILSTLNVKVKSYCQRSFAYHGPLHGILLPLALRYQQESVCFKRALKTRLFSLS